MPTPKTANAVGMVYKPSIVHEHITQQPLFLNKLSLRRSEEQHAGHTLVTGLHASECHNSVKTAIASQTYSPFDLRSINAGSKTLAETLFDARAEAKVLTAYVSMYLREGWRDKLFHQLDNLLDPDEWDPDDKPLQKQSFDTFLKAICDLNPTVRPGLGLTYNGNLIGAWTTAANNRMTLEFTQDGRVKILGTQFIDEEPVHFSAISSVGTLKKALVKFNCASWLGCA